MNNTILPPGYNVFQSIGRTLKQIKDPIGTMEESMRIYNGTYTVNLGLKRLIATQNPGFIEHVLRVNQRNYFKSEMLTEHLGRFLGKGLLTSNGDYWLRQRRLIQPGFHIDRLKDLYLIMKRTIDEFLSKMQTGLNVDVYPLMHSLAFELVINTLFNVTIPGQVRKQLSTFITETQGFVMKDIRQPHKSWWFRLNGELKKNLIYAQEVRTIIKNMIDQRMAAGRQFNDLLDMLLDARYEDSGLGMQEEQIIDEILVLLIAGHETTANALSFTLYLLANHQHELERLRETTKNVGFHESIKNANILAAINESMRLYPPAWISDRVAVDDDVYDQFKIPKDTIIAVFYYGLHRDPRYWNNPLEFKPGRFLNAATEKDKIRAFYPFGSGPRLCIGNNFALAEMTLFLHSFIHMFDIWATGQTPQLKPLVTLRPDRVLLKIKSRE
ncbi:cytochrome P450 [Chryseosolibacter indicus]|uniref:Cytochrome P450 n=1 Tax=Chryseosolibacter indicus TaxID=2782351 RepID=A0ABS5VL53_9BACT|nr:cytochrome P450 [Chryseosolibacter indicus]MBT1702183.1 cytochrome P450 [Chryseosolibacter indicus]